MKRKLDFSKGKRGRVIRPEPETRGKTRITIRLDGDLVDHFLKEADASGGAMGYQTLINEALRQNVEGRLRSSRRRCGGLCVRKCGRRGEVAGNSR